MSPSQKIRDGATVSVALAHTNVPSLKGTLKASNVTGVYLAQAGGDEVFIPWSNVAFISSRVY